MVQRFCFCFVCVLLCAISSQLLPCVFLDVKESFYRFIFVVQTIRFLFIFHSKVLLFNNRNTGKEYALKMVNGKEKEASTELKVLRLGKGTNYLTRLSGWFVVKVKHIGNRMSLNDNYY